MYNTFSLKQAAEYDHKTNAKGRISAWGFVCKERQRKGISRKALRLKKQAEKNS